MLFLFSNAVHDVRRSVLDLLLDALDAFLLFAGQVEACVEGVGTASVDLDELLILEDLLFRDEAGAGGKVPLGTFIVTGEVGPWDKTLRSCSQSQAMNSAPYLPWTPASTVSLKSASILYPSARPPAFGGGPAPSAAYTRRCCRRYDRLCPLRPHTPRWESLKF